MVNAMTELNLIRAPLIRDDMFWSWHNAINKSGIVSVMNTRFDYDSVSNEIDWNFCRLLIFVAPLQMGEEKKNQYQHVEAICYASFAFSINKARASL